MAITTKPKQDHAQELLVEMLDEAIHCSRKVRATKETIYDLAIPPKDGEDLGIKLEEPMLELVHAVRDVVATVTVPATERARIIGPFIDDGDPFSSSGRWDEDARRVDEVIRPIFEAAGIAEDFTPAEVRFPNLLDDEEETGR